MTTMDKLISSLVSDAEKEAAETVRKAESEGEKLITEEKAKRGILLRNAEDDCEHMLFEHRRERLAWARLEAKRLIAEAREDAIKNALERMGGELGRLRSAPEYAGFMKKAVPDAVEELGRKGDVTLHVVKGDRKFANGTKAKVVEDLDASGGVVAESGDGRVRVVLTLESVFELKKDDLRKAIYARLFEK